MNADTGTPIQAANAPEYAVSLTESEWDAVLQHLGKGIFDAVAPLMYRIWAQLHPRIALCDAHEQSSLLGATAASEARN